MCCKDVTPFLPTALDVLILSSVIRTLAGLHDNKHTIREPYHSAAGRSLPLGSLRRTHGRYGSRIIGHGY
jgi:hypothetical protein